MKISFVRRLLSTAEGSCSGHSTIDTLADDVLLCIFDFYRREWIRRVGVWPWRDLLHICRRWRCIAFGCPHYLKLYPSCSHGSKTGVHAALDIWPVLPLSIQAFLDHEDAHKDDITNALKHRDRIADISLKEFGRSQLKECIALMQEPYPVLRSLHLTANEKKKLVIPDTDTFLGGSAPLLQSIHLCGIRFPGLPKLLASTSDLVCLDLEGLPMTGEGHIPPDAMTACLSELTKLQSLTISSCFLRWSRSPYPTGQYPPPSAHTILPALTYLSLQGPQGYLEEIVARIDAPLLNKCRFDFIDEPTFFDTRQVPQFVCRTKNFKLLDGVEVHFWQTYLFALFRSRTGPAEFFLLSRRSGLLAQVAIMERICAQWPRLVSHAEQLELDESGHSWEEKKWWEGVTQWLGLLRPFTAVHTLRIFEMTKVSPSHLVHILGELEGERATEVLLALRTVELSAILASPPDSSETLRLLGPFLAAREEWEHPVVVVNVGSKSKYPVSQSCWA